MTKRRSVGRIAALVVDILACAVAAVIAQDTTQVAVDSTLLPTDSVSIPRNSIQVDSLSESGLPLMLPIPEPAVPLGPLPPGTRYTFTRDSIRWMSGVTLADLLVSIPGVYVARTGFLGQPEYIMYAGHGGEALELYWDGLPMMPLGRDSLHNDPGRVNLTYLDRVDVVALPSTLRVYLVSTSQASTSPRSSLRVLAGDFSTGGYAGVFQKRMSNGFGLNLAADFVGSDGASGSGRTDQTFDIWTRLDWLPSDKIGASYQMRRQTHQRDPVGSYADYSVAGRQGTRTDYLFTIHAGSRPDGLGLRAEAGVASSAWMMDSLDLAVPDQRVKQGHFALRYMRPNWTVDFKGRIGDSRVTSGLSGHLGWVPLPGVVMAGDARWSRHDAERTSLVGNGSVGLYRGPFSLVGMVQYGDEVRAPALVDDSAQKTVDRSIRAGFRSQPLSGHAGVVWRDPYLPRPFNEISAISGFDTTRATTYLVADVRLASSRALALDGWYSSPLVGEPGNLQPPKHARIQLTFRSKFWRTFRSGAFDLKVQIAAEFWSGGVGGYDANGSPVELPAASFWDAFIEFQLVEFVAFWNFRNMYNSKETYFPGLDYLRRAVQIYGVKWEFSN
ncbi:TonB-dependent receptor [Gemmatimonadota bacterium]